jgi:hypothetical protein
MKFAKLDEKTPHVCFKYEAPLSSGSDDELPRRLASQFRDRFSSVRTMKTWFSGPWWMILGTGKESHTAALGRSRFGKGEWILVVTAARTAGLFDRVFQRRIQSNVSDVMNVCREIHESLVAISGITDVRWYFEGSRGQSPAVATPDELPWPST